MRFWRAAGTVLFWVWWIVVFNVLTACLFVPWFVAWRRRVPNVGSVFVICLFLGWTVAGWVVALAMACRSRPVR